MAASSSDSWSPSLPRTARSALVIATTKYLDPSLRSLRAPAADATNLAEVLKNPDIGGFEVDVVMDETAHQMRIFIERFLSERQPDETVVVYVSSHGLTDARRRLYFAATNTEKRYLAATGIEARWLTEQMDQCRARRQVVILDCCFSGAFAAGFKGGDELNLEDLTSSGRGRAVLTASNSREYSFEGDIIQGATSVPGSIFTSALLEGLRSGAADLDEDGFVTVDEAYEYAYREVRAKGVPQTPQKWLSGGEGRLFLAKSPAWLSQDPSRLPNALTAQLEHGRPDVRIAAVQILETWLQVEHRAAIAREQLEAIAANDIPRVASVARAALGKPLTASRIQNPAAGSESLDEVIASHIVGVTASESEVSRRSANSTLEYIRNKRFRLSRKQGYAVFQVDEVIDWIEDQYAMRLRLIETLQGDKGSVSVEQVEVLLVTPDLDAKRFPLATKSGYEVAEVDDFIDEMVSAFRAQDDEIAALWRARG